MVKLGAGGGVVHLDRVGRKGLPSQELRKQEGAKAGGQAEDNIQTNDKSYNS